MKKLNKLLVAGIAAAGLCAASITTGALAQTQSTDNDDYVGCPVGGPGPGYGFHHWSHESWKDYHQYRRTVLHDKLKLNAEQEKAWADYTAVADKNLEAWKPVRRADLEKMTSPERMQTMIDRMKAHEQALTDQLAALKTFYATLTPEQQKTFDSESMYHPRFRRGGPGRR